jgi:hypothetical protein
LFGANFIIPKNYAVNEIKGIQQRPGPLSEMPMKLQMTSSPGKDNNYKQGEKSE